MLYINATILVRICIIVWRQLEQRFLGVQLRLCAFFNIFTIFLKSFTLGIDFLSVFIIMKNKKVKGAIDNEK